MKIAILGGTSQIARDLSVSFSKNAKHQLFLFGRNLASLNSFLKSFNIAKNSTLLAYDEINNHKYDVIINFVGVGDPARLKEMKSDIFKVTEDYDNLALEYIKNNTSAKYIFLSSGSVYGSNFFEPVTENTDARININSLDSSDWYSISKLYAEARHRSLNNLSIVDLRVFNYFSHTQDIAAKFFITEIVRAIKERSVLRTSPENIIRDFITPFDFHKIIQIIIDTGKLNTAFDCYTKAPISKFDLLSELEKKFEFKYLVDDSYKSLNASGAKLNYYSKSRALEKIGYFPRNSSLSGVIEEIDLALKI